MSAPRTKMLAAALLLALAGACAHTRNYTDPGGPRYSGGRAEADPDPALRVVTFNVKWGRAVDRVEGLLRTEPTLRGADVVFLQEMDPRGVDRLAAALGYAYVYYPAAFHPRAHQDFGNAVLARWPMVDDRKLVLPELNRFRRMQRIAVAATVMIGGTPVRVYSVHLETMLAIEGPQRRHQLEPILADAARFPRVIVAGDFNNRNQVGKLMTRAGYTWLTEHVGATEAIWSWDHVFVRGLALAAPGRVGTVRDVRGASDHHPVWAELAPAALSPAAAP